MKKNIAIYTSLFLMVLVGASCNNDEETYTSNASPYAYAESFAIDNIAYPFHELNVDGEDVIVEKVVSGSEFKFVVDQKTKEIYNLDSLAYKTRVNKVVATLSCVGAPYRYDEAVGDYVYFYSTDSVDYTNPVKLLIKSTDATFDNYYTIKINVHKVDPELLVWEQFDDAALENVSPAKMVEKDGFAYIFGADASQAPVVAVSSLEGAPSWSVAPSLAPSADFSTLQVFGGKFYILASGELYASVDAISWEKVSAGEGFVSLFAVTENGSKMWAATAGEILYTSDGENFISTGAVPEGFPLYNTSCMTSSLTTNASISRAMLVGYASADAQDKVKVWSCLSNNGEWYEYELGANDNVCPAFEDLQVLGYDNAMFAFGGKATVGERVLVPFEKMYVSRDNGIVWKPCNDYTLRLPKALKGYDAAVATMVSQGEYMWIATPSTVWRGRINRLGFK